MRFYPIPIVSSGNKPLSFRQQMTWSEASTRPVSTDGSIGDGPQHICSEGPFIPVAIIYGKTTDGRLIREVFIGKHWHLLVFGYCRHIMPVFAGNHKPLHTLCLIGRT